MLINKTIRAAWQVLSDSLRVLHRMQFDAPWNSSYRSKC
jgi:hypothetical protein